MKPEQTEHGFWETVFLTRPGGRPYRDGHYVTQCKCCHGERPDHASDCEVDVLQRRVEEAARVIFAEGDPDLPGRPWLVEHVLGILTDEDDRLALAHPEEAK